MARQPRSEAGHPQRPTPLPSAIAARGADFSELPEDLLLRFGTPRHVIDIDMYEGRTLALVEAVEVLKAISEQGFFLQMPPPAGHPVRSL